MKRHLLDVNVLIALADPAHVNHEKAHEWFGEVGMQCFATCPTTQNGFVRILGHPRYPNGPGTPNATLNFLDNLLYLPGHAYWPDSISVTNKGLFLRENFPSANHLTDAYLLGLAVTNKGFLATFDRRIPSASVQGGQKALVVI